MKLLIVDDEELTRAGLISSIDWKALGISQVYQADDGQNGLEAARLYRPEIILCDVRMPRMDGIAMLEQLEKILPDTVPIFMSGYSDKEYLKAAIRLKAVTYIEKPLDRKEVFDAILEAKELYIQKLRSSKAQALHSRETAARLANLLTAPQGSRNQEIIPLLNDLGYAGNADSYFTALIIKPESSLDLAEASYGDISHTFAAFLQDRALNCIHTERHGQYSLFFIFGKQPLSRTVLCSAAEFLGKEYARFGRYYMTAGESVHGILNACRSYTTAVIRMQSMFFFPANTFLYSDAASEHGAASVNAVSAEAAPMKAAPAEATPDADSPEKEFYDLLSAKNAGPCEQFLDRLYARYSQNRTFLVNQAKDLYYRLFLVLDDLRKELRPDLQPSGGNTVDALESCFSYDELHEILKNRMERFFEDLQDSAQENPVIYHIRQYIAQNYMKETLSVKDISEHVFLSASYVCTFFKNETGQTLNQYLTEYRMEKAKRLLGDPRYKIADISSRVGYNDGNYFGKSFRKYTGLSPSEYREKISE